MYKNRVGELTTIEYFPHSQDKKSGNFKNFTLYFYTYSVFLLALFLGHFWFAEWCQILRWFAIRKEDGVKCGDGAVVVLVRLLLKCEESPDVASNTLFIKC